MPTGASRPGGLSYGGKALIYETPSLYIQRCVGLPRCKSTDENSTMRDAQPREIQYFQNSTGQAPYTEWFKTIRNKTTRNRIRARLTAVASGNLGDCGPVGEGVSELRLNFGPGYRIYFGEADNTIVLLLCGGDKSSQRRDIRRAKTYWQEYKEIHR